MIINVAALRAGLAEVLREAKQQPVTVIRHGEPVAVILSNKEFAELKRLRSMYIDRSRAT